MSCAQLTVGSKVQGPKRMMKIKGSLWLLCLLAVGIRARPESGKIYVKAMLSGPQCLSCVYLNDNGVMFCEITLFKHCGMTAELLAASSSEYRATPGTHTPTPASSEHTRGSAEHRPTSAEHRPTSTEHKPHASSEHRSHEEGNPDSRAAAPYSDYQPLSSAESLVSEQRSADDGSGKLDALFVFSFAFGIC